MKKFIKSLILTFCMHGLCQCQIEGNSNYNSSGDDTLEVALDEPL